MKTNYFETIEKIKRQKQIAFSGQPGKIREHSILKFIEAKKVVIEEVEAEQRSRAEVNRERLSCKMGCTFCCYYFTEATIQECEAIAYHLIQHDELLGIFVINYMHWEEETRKISSSFSRLARSKNTQGFIINLKAALRDYHAANIACPFLIGGACSIYEVRPFACVNVVAVTPSEWCNLNHPQYINVKYYSSELLLKKEPAFSKPTTVNSISSSMPSGVNDVLTEGFRNSEGTTLG